MSALCESFIGVGPDACQCNQPADFLIGVGWDCCGDPPFVEQQFVCRACYEENDNRCVDCELPTSISEPVALPLAPLPAGVAAAKDLAGSGNTSGAVKDGAGSRTGTTT